MIPTLRAGLHEILMFSVQIYGVVSPVWSLI